MRSNFPFTFFQRYKLYIESREGISNFGEDMAVATLRDAPTTQNFPLQLLNLHHQLLVLQKVFLEFLNAALSAVAVDLEWVGPYTASGTWNVVVLPSYVDVVGIFKPIQ